MKGIPETKTTNKQSIMNTTKSTDTVIIRRERYTYGNSGSRYDYMAVDPSVYDRADRSERWGRKSEAAICTRAAAEAWIAEANEAAYCTDSNEYARPDYTIIRSK